MAMSTRSKSAHKEDDTPVSSIRKKNASDPKEVENSHQSPGGKSTHDIEVSTPSKVNSSKTNSDSSPADSISSPDDSTTMKPIIPSSLRGIDFKKG